jgi:hypothetical protein
MVITAVSLGETGEKTVFVEIPLVSRLDNVPYDVLVVEHFVSTDPLFLKMVHGFDVQHVTIQDHEH